MVKRRRSNVNERGATLFVVVLVITLLTGIGLYTVHSSGLVAQASGSGRQALQIEHLAQLGVLVTMSEISAAPDVYVPVALKGEDECRMNQGMNLDGTIAPSCYEKSSSDFSLANNATLFDSDSFADPTLAQAPMSGRFITETTDVAPTLGPVAGMDALSKNGFRFYQAKLTTIAELHPTIATTTGTCVENVMQVAGQHLTRAHVVVGPIGGP